jgi:hypothetical protein
MVPGLNSVLSNRKKAKKYSLIKYRQKFTTNVGLNPPNFYHSHLKIKDTFKRQVKNRQALVAT